MGNFISAYEKVLRNEGGYVNDPDDPGGKTYKGVSRKLWSSWDGWLLVDFHKRRSGFPANLEGDTELQEKVKDFYRIKYWDKMRASEIKDDEVAASVFDFAVNAGINTSVSLAQMVTGAEIDSLPGKETLARINSTDPDQFLASFTLARVARYIKMVRKRPSSRKYFYGWVCRTLGETL